MPSYRCCMDLAMSYVMCPMPYTIIHTYGVHGDWEASNASQGDWRDSVQR